MKQKVGEEKKIWRTNTKQLVRSEEGFSLIEVMVTVVIMGILSTVIILSSNSARSGRSIGLGAEQLVSDIRNVQNLALAGGLAPHDNDEMKPPCAFGINFKPNESKYEIIFVAQDISNDNKCGTNSLDDLLQSKPGNLQVMPGRTIDVKDIDAGLLFKSLDSQKPLLFKLPVGEKHNFDTVNNAQGDEFEIMFEHRSSGHTRTVKVAKDGYIEY